MTSFDPASVLPTREQPVRETGRLAAALTIVLAET